MSRKNLRKWLTSKYGIEFNRMTIGTYVSQYVVNVPDDERQPITALKIERYVKPIDDATIFDMFNGEGEETLTGGIQYEVSMEDITKYTKQEMAKYFNDLFDKYSYFWKINRLK